ncbi:BRO family protein [uncultured Sulfitobacter sp.]|uniref:BRO-N domain-containing protein n=1 Tax=uncultured Sulfitobacter sp. TaxID=191468 RepID=UPI0030F8ECDE
MEINGEPWFVAADAFNTLEYPKGSRTYQLKQLSNDETKALKLKTNSRGAPPKLISESGLYKLIMRSDKPQARPFQDWVTKVVLPAIRKGGGSETTNRRTPHDNHRTL